MEYKVKMAFKINFTAEKLENIKFSIRGVPSQTEYQEKGCPENAASFH